MPILKSLLPKKEDARGEDDSSEEKLPEESKNIIDENEEKTVPFSEEDDEEIVPDSPETGFLVHAEQFLCSDVIFGWCVFVLVGIAVLRFRSKKRSLDYN